MDSNIKNYEIRQVYYSIIVNWIVWTIRGRDVGAISAFCDLFVIFMLFGHFGLSESLLSVVLVCVCVCVCMCVCVCVCMFMFSIVTHTHTHSPTHTRICL